MEHATTSPIYEAATRCLSSFVEPQNSAVHAAVEDNDARFRLWAGNLGALQRHPSKASADLRLRDAPEVVSRIVEILEDIRETNEDLQSVIVEDGRGEDGKASNEDDEDGDVMRDLCLSVGDSITSLLKVSALLRRATTRDRYAVAAASKHDALPQEYAFFDHKHVSEKFPKVQQQPWLCERLAGAITQRRQFLRYAHKHHKRIANVGSTLDNNHQPTAVATLHPRSRNIDTLSAGHTLTTIGVSTKPSTLHIDRLGAMMVTDPNADNDDDDVSDATTFISTASENAISARAQVVKLDKVTKRSELTGQYQPFECPYCRGMVSCKSQRAWRKHVFRDLRAYTCTFPDCEAGLFEDKSAWFDHELESHRRIQICLACSNKTFPSEAAFKMHLQAVHGYTDAELLESLLKSSSRPVIETDLRACPLCDAWAEELKIPPESRAATTVSLGLLRRHLGDHHEQLALFAITPDLERDLDSEHGSQDSANSLVGRQEALNNWRSMIEATSEQESDLSEDEGINTAASWTDLDSINKPFRPPLRTTLDEEEEDDSNNAGQIEQEPLIDYEDNFMDYLRTRRDVLLLNVDPEGAMTENTYPPEDRLHHAKLRLEAARTACNDAGIDAEALYLAEGGLRPSLKESEPTLPVGTRPKIPPPKAPLGEEHHSLLTTYREKRDEAIDCQQLLEESDALNAD